ncbi:MAG: discoidin domain-containing protein [Clostridia bacterium]|nr:discoidin domain-containing protein [Clostridia bacterium]
MKKLFKNSIAVILSLAIVLSVLLPVLSGVISFVSAETAEQTLAISALKDAWGKMQKIETIMYPTIQKVSGTNTVADSIYTTANGLDASLPTGISANQLGDYYAYHKGAFETTGTGENRIMWSKSTTAFQTLASKIDKYDDIAFSFYIEDLTVNVSGGALQAYNNDSSRLIEESFIVTEAMKGKWTTIYSADMVNGGIDGIRSALSSKNFGWIQLNFGANKVKPKGWFGSLIGILNAEVPELDGLELINAAKALDISEYSNTEDFISALTAAEALFIDDSPKGVAVKNLKDAWGKMQKIETIMYPTIQKVSGTNTVADNLYATSNGLDASLPTGISANQLGDYYAYHTKIFDTTGTGNNRIMWSKSTTAFQMLAAKIDKYDDIAISFYIEDLTVNTSGGAIQVYDNASSPYSEKSFVITEEMKGKWTTLNSADMINGGIDGIRSALASRNFGWIQFNFGDNKVKPKGWFGSLVGIINAEVPNLSGVELISAAKALDISGYENTEAFTAALSVAEELYAEELVEANLKSAWGEMETAHRVLEYPTAYRRTAGTDQDNLYGFSTAVNANGFSLYGEQTATVNMTAAPNRTAVSSSANTYTLFMSAKPTESAVNLDRGIYINGEDAAYLYIKVNSVAKSGRLGFKIVTNGSNIFVSNYYLTVDAGSVGNWQKVSLDDLMPMNAMTDWKTQLTTQRFSRMELQLVDGAEANITVGCIMAAKSAVAPELEGVELIDAAVNLDLSNYTNTENFVSALNTAKEYYAEEMAVVNLKSAWNKMYKVDTLMSPSLEKISGTNTQSTVYNTADGIENLPAGITADKLGDYYSYHGGVNNTTGTAENRFMWSKFTSGTSAEYSRLDIADYKDIMVSFYVEDVAKAGSFNIDLYSDGTVDTADKNYSISESDEGKWITFTASDMNSGGMNAILATMKTSDSDNNGNTAKLGFLQFALGSNATKFSGWFGSLVGIVNAKAPDLSGSELVKAARKFNISGYNDTEAFVKALADAEEAYADELVLEDLKNAWQKMEVSTKVLQYPTVYRRVSKDDQDNLYNFSTALTDAEEIKLYGEQTATLDMAANPNRAGVNSHDGNSYTLFMAAKPTAEGEQNLARGFTLQNEGGAYLYIKINSVTSEGKLGFRAVGGPSTIIASSKYIDINSQNAGKWIKVTLDELMPMGSVSDWKQFFKENTFTRFELQLVGGAEANITVGCLMGTINAEIPAGNENWNVAEWVYQASRIDITGYNNTEDFVAALQKAKELRDKLGATRECAVTSYATLADVDMNADTLSNNLLKDLIPEINYYNGSAIMPIETETLELSDGLLDTEEMIPAGDFAKEGSYLELVYSFPGEFNIKNILVANSEIAALRNASYKIYTSDERATLFTKDSLLLSHDNEAGDFAQTFSFDGFGTVEGKYLALRIYEPYTDAAAFDDIVRISEFGVWGQIIRYTVTKGEFSDEEIAALGDNLLVGKEQWFRFNSGTSKERLSSSLAGYNVTTLTDGNTRTPVGMTNIRISKADDELEKYIYFDLRAPHVIDKILINHFWQAYLQTGKYEIYASNSVNTLFKSSSKVASYDNMLNGPNGSTITQVFNFDGNITARYIAYKVIFPVNDFEKAVKSWTLTNMYFRHTLFGVYGEKYVKPLKEVNLLNHTPVEVYRTDVDGKRAEVPETEFGYNEYALTTDNNYDNAVLVEQNGKDLDFVFDMCADVELTSVALNTLSKNIKRFKVYASDSKEGVWKEANLVYNYNGDATDKAQKLFAETSLEARYLRFSVIETVTGAADITEFEAIGWNTFEFEYINIVEDNASYADIYTENKENYVLDYMDYTANKYTLDGTGNAIYPFANIFDGDEGSVGDIYGGENGKESINIVVNLQNYNAIDTINVKAGSTPDYWPRQMKFYIGADETELFGENAKPIATFDGIDDADEEGNFEIKTLPTVTQYIRVEILETKNKYFNEKILAVIGQIRVNGLELVGRVDEEGVVKRIPDEETGIIVEIMGKNENDTYVGATDVMVVKRNLTAEEVKTLKDKGIKATTEMYELYLIDENGNIVDDVGGRDLRVKIPKSMASDSENTYIANSYFGYLEVIELDESIQNDKYFVITAIDTAFMSYALCEFANFDEDDGYITETDKDNDDFFFEETEEEETEDDEDEYETIIHKIKRPKKNADGFNYLWVIIAASSAVVVIAAALIILLILKKKKKEDGEVQ